MLRDLPKFLGATVTVAEPETDADGMFPKGPATVCVDLKPQKQCYTPSRGDFGLNPEVSVVQVDKETRALFFRVLSGGVSGHALHFALLRPGSGEELEDILGSET